MNREEVKKEVLDISDSHNNILAELPTGFGKTRVALEILRKHKKTTLTRVLIVVPRNVLKEEWKKEITKWKLDSKKIEYTFTTYVSFPKFEGFWDFVIFDESHHLSERCRESLVNFYINRTILLSATVSDSLKESMSELFNDLYCYKIKMKEAIDSEVLPDPRVFLIPLQLDKIYSTECIIKNPKAKGAVIECTWASRWQHIRQKTHPVKIKCTQKQYMEDLDNQIDWFKTRYLRTRNEAIRNKWLKLCGDRLKWLSEKKSSYVKVLLDKLDKERTLTFCSSIEQTEALGKYCINSKNKESKENIAKFNNGKIKHITACNMLNEGMNLVNCRVGIYANLNSSEVIIKQRLGRILRHKDPIIVIPFFQNTRDEELVKKMLEDYNPDLITVLDNLNKLKV